MKFEQNFSMLFDDLNLPELFITEYLCNANGDYVKIYLYLLFLCKHGSDISPLDISKQLSIPLQTIELGLKHWEEQGILIKKKSSYEIVDLKKIAVNNLYTPKLTSSPEQAIENMDKNIKQNKVIDEINKEFFQGVMSPIWFNRIDNMFHKYLFDEEVMIALFRYCYDRGALHQNYMKTVADSWFNNHIRTMSDLESYYLTLDATKKIQKKISKKLGITRNLNEYEEAFIDKWTKDYNYPMEVLELALKKTSGKSNISFEYIDSIISDWHDKKLGTIEDVTSYLEQQKKKAKAIQTLSQKTNPDQISLTKFFDNQNQYNDIDNLYSNL